MRSRRDHFEERRTQKSRLGGRSWAASFLLRGKVRRWGDLERGGEENGRRLTGETLGSSLHRASDRHLQEGFKETQRGKGGKSQMEIIFGKERHCVAGESHFTCTRQNSRKKGRPTVSMEEVDQGKGRRMFKPILKAQETPLEEKKKLYWRNLDDRTTNPGGRGKSPSR